MAIRGVSPWLSYCLATYLQGNKMGDTLFKPPEDGPAPQEAEDTRVSQGFIEASNVDVVKMMTEMIAVLRGYETYQKVIRSAHEAYAKSINEVGKT